MTADIHPIDYMAMWEAFVAAHDELDHVTPLDTAWDAMGSVPMRHQCVHVTKIATAFWNRLKEDDKAELAPWDFGFCPRYLATVQWRAHVGGHEWEAHCLSDDAVYARLFPGKAGAA